MYANCCSGALAVGWSYTPPSIEHAGAIETTCEERGARSCWTAVGKTRVLLICIYGSGVKDIRGFVNIKDVLIGQSVAMEPF